LKKVIKFKDEAAAVGTAGVQTGDLLGFGGGNSAQTERQALETIFALPKVTQTERRITDIDTH